MGSFFDFFTVVKFYNLENIKKKLKRQHCSFREQESIVLKIFVIFYFTLHRLIISFFNPEERMFAEIEGRKFNIMKFMI